VHFTTKPLRQRHRPPAEDCSYLLGSGNACHSPPGAGCGEDVSFLDPGQLAD
jgi:hypothetical protein